MKSKIVISERQRPLWQVIIASTIFTATFMIFCCFFLRYFIDFEIVDSFASHIVLTFYLIPIGAGFCYQHRIYIDLANSRFKPTYELGVFKFGNWKAIKNYEYISVFQQPLSDGSITFEVNIWFDKNKHFNLYERPDYLNAFRIGFELSEELNVDLYDATQPNNHKWIDKEEWRVKLNANAS